jgi:hypothetical protein
MIARFDHATLGEAHVIPDVYPSKRINPHPFTNPHIRTYREIPWILDTYARPDDDPTANVGTECPQHASLEGGRPWKPGSKDEVLDREP